MTRTIPYRILIAVVALCAATAAWPQWNFSIDTTFHTVIQRQAVNSILLTTDGNVIASGIMRFPSEFSDKRLVRLLPDGTRDPSFNNSGLGGERMIPWQDKFYVDAGIVRRILLPSGAIDPTFAVGSSSIPYFSAVQGGDFHVFPDGRVLVTGQHTLSDNVRGFVGPYDLIWFTNTGYLDTTRTHRQSNGVMWAFSELPDGKFICSCSCTQYEGQAVDRVFRIHSDGALDTTFHSGIGTGNVFAYHPLPDGRVYVGGKFGLGPGPSEWLYLVRLMPDGGLDPTFSTLALDPGWLPNPASGASLSVIHPWYDGRLIITGRFLAVNGMERNGICMVDSMGSVLDFFNGCGVGPYTYQNFTYLNIEDISADGDGILYIAGAYLGFDDCNTSDTLQRFVSRLLVTEVSTGVEVGEHALFSLYPNPASGSATLQLEHVPRNAQLMVRDALGREVQRQRVRSTTTTLSMERSGVYVVELWGNGERIATQRLVVQ